MGNSDENADKRRTNPHLLTVSLRKGNEIGLKDLQAKAMSVGTRQMVVSRCLSKLTAG